MTPNAKMLLAHLREIAAKDDVGTIRPGNTVQDVAETLGLDQYSMTAAINELDAMDLAKSGPLWSGDDREMVALGASRRTRQIIRSGAGD